MPLNVLIVDEDRFVREACREAATALGYHAMACESAQQAFALIHSQTIEVVLLGSKSSDVGPLEVLRQVKQRCPDIEVIVMSGGGGTAQSAVLAMKTGAFEYFCKPFGLEDLKLLLERVSDHFKVKIERRTLVEKNKTIEGFGGLIGRAPEMDKLYRIIGKAAQTAHPVLILGESGMGKERSPVPSTIRAHFATSRLCRWTAGLSCLR
jgi:two-component system response regulator HydG